MAELRVLVLDFDGVITSLDIDWSAVRREASKLLGRRVESLSKLLAELWSRGERVLYRRVSGVIEGFEYRAVEKARPFPDVVGALEYALGRGLVAYIATLQGLGPVNSFLERHGLRAYFRGIVARDHAPEKKLMLSMIASWERVGFENILFFDDTPRHVEEARGVGARAVLLRNSVEEPRLRKALEEILD